MCIHMKQINLSLTYTCIERKTENTTKWKILNMDMLKRMINCDSSYGYSHVFCTISIDGDKVIL